MPAVVVITTAALIVTGCAPQDSHVEPAPSSTAQPDTSQSETAQPLTNDDVVVSRVVTTSPEQVSIDIHPLVRTDGALVLTITASDVDPLRAAWAADGGPAYVGARLMDLDGETIGVPLVDEGGKTVVGGDDGTLQLLYPDPGTDTVDLFLPLTEPISDVPVIDGEAPVSEREFDVAGAVRAEMIGMSSFTVDLTSTGARTVDPDAITLRLGGDVLFDTDSSELSAAAEQIIAEAAVQIAAREPGTVQVVGHTDSRDTDAYNLDLSERRAATVASALAQLVDAEAYPIESSGRGEQEPIASNSSALGRAENRRVEILLATPPLETATRETADGTAPVETTLPTATGADGYEIASGSRTYRLTAPTAWVQDGHLVVELRTEATDDFASVGLGPALFSSSFAAPDGLAMTRTMAAVIVVDGHEGTLPVLHRQAASLYPLTDLSTFVRLDGGDVKRSFIVYPATVPVGESVTIQLHDPSDLGIGWRMTDIPLGEPPA